MFVQLDPDLPSRIVTKVELLSHEKGSFAEAYASRDDFDLSAGLGECGRLRNQSKDRKDQAYALDSLRAKQDSPERATAQHMLMRLRCPFQGKYPIDHDLEFPSRNSL